MKSKLSYTSGEIAIPTIFLIFGIILITILWSIKPAQAYVRPCDIANLTHRVSQVLTAPALEGIQSLNSELVTCLNDNDTNDPVLGNVKSRHYAFGIQYLRLLAGTIHYDRHHAEVLHDPLAKDAWYHQSIKLITAFNRFMRSSLFSYDDPTVTQLYKSIVPDMDHIPQRYLFPHGVPTIND